MTHPLFGEQTDFLSHTLINASDDFLLERRFMVSSGEFRLVRNGILEIIPNHSEIKSGLLLSAGIHGNETAPIEMLNRLVGELLEQKRLIQRPMLIVLGHPLAMAEQKRFLRYNLNRLFLGTHAHVPYAKSEDAKRAAILETAVEDFHAQYPLSMHLDLHTAIRPSRIEKFAVYPYVPGREPNKDIVRALQDSGIQALILNTTSSTTFTAHTANRYGAEAYTLELGQVRAFGQNDPAAHVEFQQYLEHLSSTESNKKIAKNHHAPVSVFKVAHEILNRSNQFQLHVESSVENFTEYAPGTPIWENGEQRYIVGETPEYIVFPNTEVPVGQRAGLMLRKIDF